MFIHPSHKRLYLIVLFKKNELKKTAAFGHIRIEKKKQKCFYKRYLKKSRLSLIIIFVVYTVFTVEIGEEKENI